MSNTFISSKKSFTAIIAIMIISLTTLAASAVVLANAEQTQEHIDYRFVIYDQNSKSVFEQ